MLYLVIVVFKGIKLVLKFLNLEIINGLGVIEFTRLLANIFDEIFKTFVVLNLIVYVYLSTLSSLNGILFYIKKK